MLPRDERKSAATTPPFPSLKDIPALGACVGLFLAIAAPVLRYVSMDQDGAYFAQSALAILRQDPSLFWRKVATIKMFFTLPVMFGTYHGPMLIYTYLPFVALWPPPSMAALNVYALFFGAILVGAVYFLSLLIYEDRYSAFAAACFLAACPGLLTVAMLIQGAAVSIPALGTSALCLFSLYARKRRPWLVYLGLACLGWVLATLSWSLTFLFGLALYTALERRQVLAAIPSGRAERRRFVVLCLAAFIIPLIPTLIGAFVTHQAGLRMLLGHKTQGGPVSAPRVYTRDFSTVLSQLDYYFYPAYPWRISCLLPVFALLTLGGVYSGGARRYLLPLVIGGAGLFLAPLSPTAVHHSHLVAFLPMITMMPAVLPCLTRHKAWRRGARALLIIAVLAVACRAVRNSVVMRNDFRQHGYPCPQQSSAVLDVCRWTARRGPKQPEVSLVTGLSATLAYCSIGKAPIINPQDDWKIYPDGWKGAWKQWLANKYIDYICVDRDPEQPLRKFNDRLGVYERDLSACDQLRAAVAGSKGRKRLVIVKSFPRPDGSPGFVVYRVVSRGLKP